MNYHARSFIKKGYVVDLCGYLEEGKTSDLEGFDEDLTIREIPIVRNTMGLPFVVFALWKVVAQILGLVYLLWDLRCSNYIMIQNPPSIPILLISICFKYLFGSKIIIDWHNLNYSILAIKLGDKHLLVTICKMYEKHLGRFADINLTVTKAMKKYLVQEFTIQKKRIIVLYDKANNSFSPLTTEHNKKQMLLELSEKYPKLYEGLKSDEKIIVSSTSFTPDEDFNILLKALKQYEQSTDCKIPLRVIITGKGPQQSEFLLKVAALKLQKVSIHNAWLEFEDYPKVLSIADLGISLHTSSSGLDLPMKIVDMFGCGIPVISLDFPAIGELVEDGKNGIIVDGSQMMFDKLRFLIEDSNALSKLRLGANEKSLERWDDNWDQNLGKVMPN
ncbi:hypothetical protein WICPIJ_000805 [Wickerhamomyces pijperi]|uniref:Chitobiosyldiphosphodolichol beta-mannosyltransferase n=1 Tax=Wickerhamomyces pijperi TaxID=599730 RepID=A0A9P8TRI9_WICPI|nr:hypothetical protein WICPIJ_000805 [Wickerhamomyces pijperi]